LLSIQEARVLEEQKRSLVPISTFSADDDTSGADSGGLADDEPIKEIKPKHDNGHKKCKATPNTSTQDLLTAEVAWYCSQCQRCSRESHASCSSESKNGDEWPEKVFFSTPDNAVARAGFKNHGGAHSFYPFSPHKMMSTEATEEIEYPIDLVALLEANPRANPLSPLSNHLPISNL
jgi:hypothetical protein